MGHSSLGHGARPSGSRASRLLPPLCPRRQRARKPTVESKGKTSLSAAQENLHPLPPRSPRGMRGGPEISAEYALKCVETRSPLLHRFPPDNYRTVLTGSRSGLYSAVTRGSFHFLFECIPSALVEGPSFPFRASSEASNTE